MNLNCACVCLYLLAINSSLLEWIRLYTNADNSIHAMNYILPSEFRLTLTEFIPSVDPTHWTRLHTRTWVFMYIHVFV